MEAKTRTERSPEPLEREQLGAFEKICRLFRLPGARPATNHRRDFRYPDAVEKAVVLYRDKRKTVRVMNISERGVMIRTPLAVNVGENVRVEFDGFGRMNGVVRWMKEDRIGIDLG